LGVGADHQGDAVRHAVWCCNSDACGALTVLCGVIAVGGGAGLITEVMQSGTWFGVATSDTCGALTTKLYVGQ
jgi:hypothetical protein